MASMLRWMGLTFARFVGLAYLFSFDGPARFRTRWVRVLGWLGMLGSVLLPLRSA